MYKAVSLLRSYLTLDIQNELGHKRHALSKCLWNGTEQNELELWQVQTLESGNPSEKSFLGYFRTFVFGEKGPCPILHGNMEFKFKSLSHR